jgi:hypothetical protein
MFKLLSLVLFIPWILFVFVLMIVAHFVGLPLAIGQPLGMTFVILYVLALIVEFIKSSRTQDGAFMPDLIFSVIALVTGTAFISYLICNGKAGTSMPVVYWFGVLITIADAIVSPWNSLRASRRDMTVY